jgi:hypothetical protein
MKLLEMENKEDTILLRFRILNLVNMKIVVLGRLILLMRNISSIKIAHRSYTQNLNLVNLANTMIVQRFSQLHS